MKTLLVVLCLVSLNAFADHHEGMMEGKTFEEKKAKMTEMLDNRISHLNEAKSCVTGAKDDAALKACHEQMKEHRKEMKEEWHKKKEEWKANKKKK